MERPLQEGRRIIYMIVIATLCFCLYVLGSQQSGINDYRENEADIEQRIDKLKEEEDRLKKEKELLNDPAYLEKLAREEYDMVGKDELPIVIVEKGAKGE